MKKLLGGIFISLLLSINVFANFSDNIEDISSLEKKQNYIQSLETKLETNNSKVSSSYKSALPSFKALINQKFNTKQSLTAFIKKLEALENNFKSDFKYVITSIKLNAEIIYLNNYLDLEENNTEIKDNNKEEEVSSEKISSPAKLSYKIVAINYNDFWHSFIPYSTGSWVLIEKNKILTNAHVILKDEKKEIPFTHLAICENRSFTEKPKCVYTGRVEAFDKEVDVALIKLDDKDIFWEKVDLVPEINIRDKEVSLGEQITIYWYPGIWGSTITLTEWKISGQDDGRYKTDALIDHGSSWGWVFDKDWNLMAISVAWKTDNNTIGYLVPQDKIKTFLEKNKKLEEQEKINLERFIHILNKWYDYDEKKLTSYNNRWVEIKDVFKDIKQEDYTIIFWNYHDYIMIKDENYIVQIIISDIIDNNWEYFERENFDYERRNKKISDLILEDDAEKIKNCEQMSTWSYLCKTDKDKTFLNYDIFNLYKLEKNSAVDVIITPLTKKWEEKAKDYLKDIYKKITINNIQINDETYITFGNIKIKTGENFVVQHLLKVDLTEWFSNIMQLIYPYKNGKHAVASMTKSSKYKNSEKTPSEIEKDIYSNLKYVYEDMDNVKLEKKYNSKWEQFISVFVEEEHSWVIFILDKEKNLYVMTVSTDKNGIDWFVALKKMLYNTSFSKEK